MWLLLPGRIFELCIDTDNFYLRRYVDKLMFQKLPVRYRIVICC